MDHSEWIDRMRGVTEMIRAGDFGRAESELSNILVDTRQALNHSLKEWHENEVLELQVTLADMRGADTELVRRAESLGNHHVLQAKLHAHAAAVKFAAAGLCLTADSTVADSRGYHLLQQALLYGGLSGEPSPMICQAGERLQKLVEQRSNQ